MTAAARRRTAARAVLCLPLFAAACAGGPPALRPGLWTVHGEIVENPGDKHSGFSYQLCRDPGFDRSSNSRLEQVPGCTTRVARIDAGRYASASTCRVAGVTIVSEGTSVYRPDGSLHSETRSKYTPALNGKTDETLAQDQRYAAPCPAGMTPGDTLEADGLIRHHAQ